jgi:ribonuclease BN (tRNA processing enzyme)
MQVVFLGTNGWYDTDTGNTICILITTTKYYIIFDAGNGIYKIDNYCKKKKPAYLLLSHFHLDHIVGLHILNKIKCFRELRIFGPKGTKNILKKFINKPFTMPISQLPFPVEIYELPRERKKSPFYVDTKPLLHSSLTLGYKLELDGKIIAYCPDTGYCDEAVELSKNADLLIAECAYKIGQKNDKWPHLNPEDAARLAKESRAKKLALVHFDADIYKTLEERKEAEKHAQGIFGNTFAAMDDMEFEIRG